MIPLLPRQQQAYEFIKNYVILNGRTPSVTEVQKAMRYANHGAAHDMLKRLQRAKVIRLARASTRYSRVVIELVGSPADLAMQACRQLAFAYEMGKRRGGTVDWQDVDDAYLLATKAIEAAKSAERKET